MPIHDWTRVDAGIFHHFHLGHIVSISRTLNQGVLPADYYALIARFERRPDLTGRVFRRRVPQSSSPLEPADDVRLCYDPPPVELHASLESKLYAAKANQVTIRHVSDHRLVAVVHVVSPGNKNSRHGLRTLLRQHWHLLHHGVHLLVLDLFSPSRHDLAGLPDRMCRYLTDQSLAMPADRPLSVAAYTAGLAPEAFVQPLAVGELLPDMPLFLTPDVYVPVPLEATYEEAWDGVPSYWREVVSGARSA